jgi:hypothetical protein
MLMPITVKSIRDDPYAILAADSCPIVLEETLAEWRAKVSVQELQETENQSRLF